MTGRDVLQGTPTAPQGIQPLLFCERQCALIHIEGRAGGTGGVEPWACQRPPIGSPTS
jgi:hypothetical protein